MKDPAKAFVYFPGLNGIRALAASAVILVHFNQFANLFGLSAFYAGIDLAGIAVTVFFVLSGFLITFLLLQEKKEFGTVSLPKFYMRRILRIWPLYYFILLCTFIIYVVIGTNNGVLDLKKTFLLFAFFVPNYAYVLQLTLTPITPLWSIGVEEQFYLIWPWIFRLIKSTERIRSFLLAFLLAFLALKFIVHWRGSEFWYNLISITRLDCMALGGLGAYFLETKQPVFLKIIYHPLMQCLALGAFVWTIVYKPVHVASVIDHELYGLLALVLIMNVSSNPATLVRLENKILNFLGKISYGLYCYHMLIIYLLSRMLSGVHLHDVKMVQIGMFLLVYCATVVIAWCSFHTFEKRFINLKGQFSKVFSRNSKPALVTT